MTVKELIVLLNTFDEDSKVIIKGVYASEGIVEGVYEEKGCTFIQSDIMSG